jgi:hypothetical protein
MKYVIAIALLTLSAVVHAETITLGSEACTATNLCFNVPNNAGLSISISNATQYGRLIIYIGNEMYDSGLWAYPNLANATLYDALGNPLQVSISFTVVQKPCVREGRATVCPRRVTLNGGTLTTP